MPRPHPVVGLAAEITDAARRRIDQPHVLDLQLLLQPVLRSAEIGAHVAAPAGLPLAGGDQRLAVGLEPLGAAEAVHLRAQPAVHGGSHFAQVLDHVDARTRRGRQFVTQARRQEAVGQVVLTGLRIVLHRAVDAVVVGGDEPLRREKRRRAPTERGDRGQGRLVEIAQPGRIELQPGLLQRGGDILGLAGHPHAFLRESGERGGREQQATGDGSADGAHGNSNEQGGGRLWSEGMLRNCRVG